MVLQPAVQDGATPAAGMVCGAKRIRSIYLPSPTGRPPRLSTTTSPERPDFGLHYQWRDHASAWRLCRADLPAPCHPIAEGSPDPRWQQVVRA